MNILTDALPHEVEICGGRYPVNADFRYGILLSSLFLDSGADAYGKVDIALELFSPALHQAVYDGRVGAEEAFAGVVCFFTCGHGMEKGGGISTSKGEISFDFDYDAERIFAAFYAVYGVDLTCCEMHWWKFMALLRGLPADCELMRVIQLRLVDTTKIADDDVRRRVRRAKAAVRVRN